MLLHEQNLSERIQPFNASDAVYADPVDLFHFYPDNSVTGFATGATDETGKYEFKTVTGA